MLREEIVTNEVQHDLDRLGIAKNAREEKMRARDAKLKERQENERMMKLYRKHVLKEQPGAGPGADRRRRARPPNAASRSARKSAASATKRYFVGQIAAGPESPDRRFCS